MPRVVRDIAADIYNNIQHWNTLHIKGASAINDLAGIKANSNKLYPDGIELLITEMVPVIEGLRTISNGLLASAQQISSLERLHKSPVPLFISWSVEKMSQTCTLMAEAYKTEFKVN